MTIRLIAVDLDGTLLTTEKTITGETMSVLEMAAEKGCMVVPCTGRPYSRVPEVVRALPFVRYLITNNGARIYDLESEEILYRNEIDVAVAEQVLDYAVNRSMAVICYRDGEIALDETCVKRAWNIFSYERDAREMSRREPIKDFKQWLRDNEQPLEAIRFFLEDSEQVQQEFARMTEAFPMCAVSCFYEKIIDVNALNVSKGEALLYLCRYLDIAVEECMALGDCKNDISMLRMAGTGIAMGNASKAVKDMADEVTESNDMDGVAKAIKRYILPG